MIRSELEHAIRAAARIMQANSIIVIGSQSILGTWSEDELPPLVTASPEVDMMPLSDDDSEALARRLDFAGEWSAFHQAHGFYIDGVGRSTATLPRGWEERLVDVEAVDFDGVRSFGLCLDPHDLCVAKVVAHREKDRAFVDALIVAGLIDPEVLLERLTATERIDGISLDYAYAWLLDRVGSNASTTASKGPARSPGWEQPRDERGRFEPVPQSEPEISL